MSDELEQIPVENSDTETEANVKAADEGPQDEPEDDDAES
jgi:hypothetical protein